MRRVLAVARGLAPAIERRQRIELALDRPVGADRSSRAGRPARRAARAAAGRRARAGQAAPGARRPAWRAAPRARYPVSLPSTGLPAPPLRRRRHCASRGRATGHRRREGADARSESGPNRAPATTKPATAATLPMPTRRAGLIRSQQRAPNAGTGRAAARRSGAAARRSPPGRRRGSRSRPGSGRIADREDSPAPRTWSLGSPAA